MMGWLSVTSDQIGQINALTPAPYKVHALADIHGALHLPACVIGAEWLPPAAQAIVASLPPSAPQFPTPSEL